jgi:hypothetical protein
MSTMRAIWADAHAHHRHEQSAVVHGVVFDTDVLAVNERGQRVVLEATTTVVRRACACVVLRDTMESGPTLLARFNSLTLKLVFVELARVSSRVMPMASPYGNWRASVALTGDGRVITWGKANGGDSSAVAPALASGEVEDVSTSIGACAALLESGRVVTWGDAWAGGDSSAVAAKLADNVVSLTPNMYAFAALKEDGSVVTWGAHGYGGDSAAVATELSNSVSSIRVAFDASAVGFIATLKDGTTVRWGCLAPPAVVRP